MFRTQPNSSLDWKAGTLPFRQPAREVEQTQLVRVRVRVRVAATVARLLTDS